MITVHQLKLITFIVLETWEEKTEFIL